MKKILFPILALCLTSVQMLSQAAKSDFDKKYRFGLRVTPQPTWLTSNDKNNVPNGTTFGMGFGLNMEIRFSDVAGFLTGIGGDFEGGKYKFKYDTSNSYVVQYYRDADEFVSPPSGSKAGMTRYILKERVIRTTHVTIPLILKLSTQEYSGLKYFGMFGGELGIRVKSQASDSYYEVGKYDSNGNYSVISKDETETGINVQPEGSLVPLRFGVNGGLGVEYRLAGSTSVFLSINYFKGLTNLFKKEADYTFYRGDDNPSYKFVKQSLKQSAVRINIGIMF
jgi:hypothetical protein